MLQVDELHIHIPGTNEESGAALGRQIAESMVASLPANLGTRHIPELRVQITSPVSGDTSFMADRVAEHILRQIKLATL